MPCSWRYGVPSAGYPITLSLIARLGIAETLIDFEALNPLFERVLGDKRVLREWLGHPPAWTQIGTEETCDVPARS